MNIAIEGCAHGQLDEIYKQIEKLEKASGVLVDLLIICGDFQALRNNMDMECMHCPEKYRKLGNFFEYYNGTRQPYVPTIFIGGNHQAVNYSRELYFGGWASKGIYYLGQSGSIYVKKGDFKIRVTGLSGIFNFKDFMINRIEPFPFSHNDLVPAYHCKQIDIFKLQLLARNTTEQFDIFLSHDWPTCTITKHGDEQSLINDKPYFKQEMSKNELGNPALEYLESKVQSSYWFSAHLHVKFAAVHPHGNDRFTHFLALDKCLKGRDYLQVVQLGQQPLPKTPNTPITFQHDLQWLTILKLTNDKLFDPQLLYKFQNRKMVPIDKNLLSHFSQKFTQTKQQLSKSLSDKLQIPDTLFKETVLAGPGSYRTPDSIKINNQTERLLKLLDIDREKFKNVLFYNNEKTKQHGKKEEKGEEKEGKHGMEGWDKQEEEVAKPSRKSKEEEEIPLEL